MTSAAHLAHGLARLPLGPTRMLHGPVTALARRGRAARSTVAAQLDRAIQVLVPLAVRRVLDQIDLTAVVQERVDLDAVAEGIDVDRVVARVDIGRIIDRVDIGQIIDRVDIGRIIDRVDIERIIDRVDIDRIIDRVDIDRIIDRVDIERIIDRVDIDAIAARVDLDAIVDRIDLIGLADYVVEGIDLPGIVRESSGSMASEALSGVRMQSLAADEALARALNRWLPRRRGTAPVPPGSVEVDEAAALPGQRAPDETELP